MSDLVKETLRRLVKEHGEALCSEIGRLKGLLSDACPPYRKEINVLILAVQEGLVAEIKRGGISEVHVHSLSSRLHNATGIDKALAEWSIRAWVVAMEKTLYCSFCNKSQHDVRRLVAGPTAFICDECVKLCLDAISEGHQTFELDITELRTNPYSPRGVITPDSLNELTESIREQGILNPLVVAKTPAGYQIIAGERRWRAAKILGQKKVPVTIKDTTPLGMLEMPIIENVHRKDLDPIEIALAYRRLIDEFGLDTTEVAKRVGKSVPAVSNTIRLLSLPDSIKDALVAGVITEGHVRPMLSLGDAILMLDVFKTILKDNYTARQTEKLVRKIVDGTG